MQTKLTLTSFTILLIFLEIVTFWIPWLGIEYAIEYYIGWFLLVAVVNLLLSIIHMKKNASTIFYSYCCS